MGRPRVLRRKRAGSEGNRRLSTEEQPVRELPPAIVGGGVPCRGRNGIVSLPIAYSAVDPDHLTRRQIVVSDHQRTPPIPEGGPVGPLVGPLAGPLVEPLAGHPSIIAPKQSRSSLPQKDVLMQSENEASALRARYPSCFHCFQFDCSSCFAVTATKTQNHEPVKRRLSVLDR